MSSNVDVRRSKIPGVPDTLETGADPADDFEPPEASEPETENDGPATGDGGDPYPVPGSGSQ